MQNGGHLKASALRSGSHRVYEWSSSVSQERICPIAYKYKLDTKYAKHVLFLYLIYDIIRPVTTSSVLWISMFNVCQKNMDVNHRNDPQNPKQFF